LRVAGEVAAGCAMKVLVPDSSWSREVRQVHAEYAQFASPDFAPNVYSWYTSRTRMVVDLVKKHAPGARTVLDIGCAQGTIAIELGKLGYAVIGNDIRDYYIEYARMLDDGAKVQFVCSNFLELDAPHRFDVVILTEVIEHIVDHKSFLRKIHDSLVPGGVFIVTTPNHGYFRESLPSYSELTMSEHREKQFSADGSDHFYLFKKSELIALAAKNSFDVLEHRYFLPFIQYGCFKSALLWKALPTSLMEKLSDIFDNNSSLCAQQYIVARST
jgi:2-polyprenyl-3-methyl-5-hydroxy-6-metoxy-1,4-benzoquinol methylase